MPTYDEIELAALVRSLPPAPQAWVEAARQLPQSRLEPQRLLPLIERDAELRAAMTEDLEAALAQVGVEPEPHLLAALRRRLAADGRPD